MGINIVSKDCTSNFMDYLELPIFATGETVKIGIRKNIDTIKSHFQDISIIDTFDYGKCLVIDGIVQTSEFDHKLYDRTILSKLSEKDKDILILGGGDGYVAQAALEINPAVNIMIVDLDIEVVKACKKNLDQKVFECPNVKLMIGDVIHFMEMYDELYKGKFDGVICDLTDNPVGGNGNEEKFKVFYSKIFKFSKNILKDHGWISVQAGSSESIKKYIHSAKILTDLLEENFNNVSKEDILIPSFGEECAFVFGKK